MPSSDSDNVIEATPPRQTKLFKKKVKSDTKSEHSLEDYIIHIPLNHTDTLKSFTTSTNFNKPYIFYGIEEVLKLPKNNILNNNIHTIGLYKFHGNTEHYLTIHWMPTNEFQVSLNFKYVTNTPKNNEILSVYGSVNNNMFVVKFYKVEAKAIVDKYIENLKYLRSIIPTNYLMYSENSN